MSSNKNSLIDRRRFLAGLALGASAAPLVTLSRGVFAGDREAVDSAAGLCFANKRVLAPSDFTYLGAMRVSEQTNMTFSYGTLTGRRVNGAVRLIMSGNVVSSDPVYEFEDTGKYSPDPAGAPRMPMVRAWGDIYGSARRSWLPDGTAKVNFPRYPASLVWNEDTQLLYWTYYDAYNVTGVPDWCLGATRLDASGPVAFGPWRPAGGGMKGPWRCLRMTRHPVSAEMLCGSFMMSGNVGSPWGPDMWAGQFPTASTPAGVSAPDLPLAKCLTYYYMGGNIKRDGTWNGPLKACRRPGDYFFEPFELSPQFNQIDPQRNGGVGSWTELDGIGGMAWIDLPDVHGVLFTAKLASGHVWYRNAGALTCTHGFKVALDITGPVSTDAYPAMFIYDPADIDAVRAGNRVDYTINPAHLINAQSQFGLVTASIDTVGNGKSLQGVYFDAPSRKLYVAAGDADRTIGGIALPLIHVFKVA